ncbi:MAG: AAA family ATPase [Imperialibacter sp.]|uniref:AAA family ATPase n=1 Tax=Imperialibacter sp. TaxID=2038411 RepID=UPI0032EBF163
MNSQNLVISKLVGYSGIRLKDEEPLTLRPGINLLVGRNGCGKTNLLSLIQTICTGNGDLAGRVESSFLIEFCENFLRNYNDNTTKNIHSKSIVEYCMRGKHGQVELSFTKQEKKDVVNNLINFPESLRQSFKISATSSQLKHQLVRSNLARDKIEMSGNIMSNFFSAEHDNKAHSLMEEPVHSMSEFIRNRMLELFGGNEFKSRIKELEDSVNSKLGRFLHKTNKRITINHQEITRSGRISMSLMDDNNYIKSEDISTGESVLLNLIFALTSAKEVGPDVVCFDEPEIHLHDDMTQTLADYLFELSLTHPESIIVIATHSTPLIEKLVTKKAQLANLITFDQQRKVSNSKRDVDLINSLVNNGVAFSPLMLSKRVNIFIENQGKEGLNHKEFLVKFFDPENRPNVIPIGSSGNVDQSDSFTGVFEEILRVSKVGAIGIQDGDIWFKSRLKAYIRGELELEKFIDILTGMDGMYIPSGKPNQYFFNFWEIENLYLMEELLGHWTQVDGTKLSKIEYTKFLRSNVSVISAEYFNTFLKSIISSIRLNRISVEKSGYLQEVHQEFRRKVELVDIAMADYDGLKRKMDSLINAVLEKELFWWVPGKEAKKLISNRGYSFTSSGFDFETFHLGKSIRAILDQEVGR